MDAIAALPGWTFLVFGLPLILAGAFLFMWLVVLAYHRVFRRRTRRATAAVARALHLAPAASPDPRIACYRGTFLDHAVELAADAWLPVVNGAPRLEYMGPSGFVLRVWLPRALATRFVLDGGRGIEDGTRSGYDDIDNRYRVTTGDEAGLHTLLASAPLRAALLDLPAPGVRPLVTQDGVNLMIVERLPADARAAAERAVKAARLLAERGQFLGR